MKKKIYVVGLSVLLCICLMIIGTTVCLYGCNRNTDNVSEEKAQQKLNNEEMDGIIEKIKVVVKTMKIQLTSWHPFL